MKILLTLSFLFFSKTTFSTISSDDILGLWISKNNDLKVEIFKQNNKYFGKIIWFYCTPKTPVMEAYLDTENPNKLLKKRPWLGMVNVSNLEFSDNQYWKNGLIYDPNSGRTYSAIVKKKTNNTLIVRGYWGFEFIGKSLEFTKL